MTAPRGTSALANLIAPCGINCRVCRAHQRQRNPCPGCRADDADKPPTRVICRIKTCPTLAARGLRFCSACPDFPCELVVHLDKRYRTKYGTSVIENLRLIQHSGISKFLDAEAAKWTCARCGGLLCMHVAACPTCGHPWHS